MESKLKRYFMLLFKLWISLRFDVNLSLKPSGLDTNEGTRVEIKNINSIKHIKQAIDYEIKRQTENILHHKMFGSETRTWDVATRATIKLRSKESSESYGFKN